MMVVFSVLVVLIYTTIGNAQYTATVVSSPSGDGSNGFPVSSALSLTCMITPPPAQDATVTYEWIENCDAIPPCFVNGQTTATVSTSRLKAEDSGSYQCRPTVNGVSIFSTNEFTVRVTGVVLETVDSNNNDNVMTIRNYSYFYDDRIPTRITCRSGLLLPAGNASFLGGWYYNGQALRDFESVACRDGDLFVTTGTSVSDAPGAVSILNCNHLSVQFEGLYICRIQDNDLTVHELKVGFYFDRGAPTLFGPVINGSDVALHRPVFIGCLADGVPPDQFFLSKDGVVINSNYTVETDSVNETHYSAIIQHDIISLQETDYGVYECTYITPVQTITSSSLLGGPLMPPQNFAAVLVTSDSFTLSWTLLPGLEPGGLQIGYVIQCNPGDHIFMVNGSVNRVVVTGLLGHTIYSCTIYGYSQVNGPTSEPLSITTLQGVPSAPRNVNVMVTSSTAITVSWQIPSVTNGIISHYTLYYQTDAMVYSMVVTYNGEMSQSQVISDLQPYQDVAVNISATAGGGEGPKSNQITVRTLADLPDYVRSVQVVSQSDTSSIVQWMPPMYPNGVITKYRLIFTSSNSSVPDDITVDGNVRSYSITNLAPGILYQVLVMTENEIGSGPAVIQEFFTKQLTPAIAPQNVIVRRYSDVMFVSWNELSTVQSRGFPIYIVQYQPANSGSPLETNAITENYVIIENLVPNVNYLVSVAAAVREGQEVLMGPNSESIVVTAVSSSRSSSSCSEESDCSGVLGLAIVFIILFLICLVILIALIVYMWRQWKKAKEDEESQTNLAKTVFEFASRENFHLHSSQASISAIGKHKPTSPAPVPPSAPPAVSAPPPNETTMADNNELNVYETIDKRVRSNRRREAELQRASTVSTGTVYESIDRKNKPVVPTRSNTVSADSQPTRNPSSIPEEKRVSQDFSDPYTFDKTLERQARKPIVTDIYADSIAKTSNQQSLNQESLNRESVNRDSINLEMFTPAIEVTNWQAPQDDRSDQQVQGRASSPSTGDKTTPTYATIDKRKKTASHDQPEDMVSLID